jgi:hypothetical protein
MFSTWIGVVLLLAFFGLLALVVIGASPRGDTYEKKRAKARAEKLQALREETTKALTTYAWVDKAKGVVRIPINDAMKLTVAELAQKTPAPANPIATPEVNPPAQGAAPTAPASSPTASASGTPKSSASPAPNPENRNRPAAADNKPSAPGTQPAASTAPAAAASSPSPAVKASVSPSVSPSSPSATPLPVRGKTP